jgi:hypothetical protein
MFVLEKIVYSNFDFASLITYCRRFSFIQVFIRLLCIHLCPQCSIMADVLGEAASVPP